MIKRAVVIIIILIIGFNLEAQNKFSIFGKVINDNNDSIAYFNIALLNSDSSFVKAGSFTDGLFALSNLETKAYILKISAIGYKSKYINFQPDGNPSLNLGIHKLEVVTLKEVVVVAKRPLIRLETNKLIVNIEGTVLSEAGSLMEALMRSPGIIVDRNNNIEIFGKGTPLVLIDDREASKVELEALQSNMIDRIEIERNPSAKYDALAHAVVKIITKRSKQIGVSLMVNNNTTFGRKISDAAGIQVNYKNKIMANLFSYSFKDRSTKNNSQSYETIVLPNYTLQNNGNEIDNSNDKSYNIFSANDFTLNKRNKLGIQFDGNWLNDNTNSPRMQNITKTGQDILKRKIQSDEKSNNDNYNANISYTFNKDSLHSLSIIVGYALKTKNSDNILEQTNLNANTSINSKINNKNNYSVYSIKGDYKFSILKNLTTTVGVRYAAMHNNGSSVSGDIDNEAIYYSENSNINDKITAGYILIEKKFKQLTMEAGLRYENTNTHTKTQDAKIDTCYNSLFPNFSLNYEFSDKCTINLNYSRKITRPRFNEINPNVIYFDSLSYSTGNPFLKPAYCNEIELNTSLFHDLIITLGYSKNVNDIIDETAMNDAKNPDISKYTSINIKESQRLKAGIIFSKSYKLYNFNIETNIYKPYVKVPSIDRKVLFMNKPTWNFSIKNDYNILKNITTYCEFSYNSAGNYLNSYWHAYSNLSTGMIWKLDNNKWQLSLSIQDILNKYKPSSWDDAYGNIKSGMILDMDARWIRIGVRYNFNNFKNIIKKRTSAGDELDRS
jgi:outer membrane receptor protein involved in Fe transport